jgi:class 3 adenylate cyclase
VETDPQANMAAPTLAGTVTFVFTDVEGSTRLLNSLREEYGQLLDDYYEIVGGAFDRNGGV